MGLCTGKPKIEPLESRKNDLIPKSGIYNLHEGTPYLDIITVTGKKDNIKIEKFLSLDLQETSDVSVSKEVESQLATNFFIDAGPNDIGTIFRNPNVEPMNPWEFNTTEMNDAKNFNPLTYQTTNYEAKPGTLLIFRGHLHHGTNIKVTPHQRITLNYNYK